jgi:tetratricopeptide (TPR) repeat protein
MRGLVDGLLAAVGVVAGCVTPARQQSDDPLAPARAELAAADDRAALASLDRHLARDPRDLEALRLRAHCLVKLADYDAALPAFERCLELAPGDAWTHYGYGAVLKEVGRYDDAIASFSRAIGLEADFYKAWQHRADAWAIVGEHERAAADFARAIELTPRDDAELPSLHRWRAQSLDALGRAGEARRARDLAARLSAAASGRGTRDG